MLYAPLTPRNQEMDSTMIQTLMDGLKLMCVVYIMIEISKYAITVVYDVERRQLRYKQIQVMDEVLELLRKSRVVLRSAEGTTEGTAEGEETVAEGAHEENHHVD